MIIPLTNTVTDVNLLASLLKCLKLDLAPTYMDAKNGIEIYRNDTHELTFDCVNYQLTIKEL